MALINIVIPTCNRSETLYWSVKSCLDQDYDDYLIWVCDNNSTDNTEEIIRNFQSDKIIYLKNPRKTSMVNNWEFALKHIELGYVMYIGDDDGLARNCLKYLADLLNQEKPSALKLFPSTFFWENTSNVYSHIPSKRLCVYNHSYYKHLKSEDILNKTSQVIEIFPYSWLLPSIYYGLIDIDIIRAIRKRDGKFFNSPIPDIYSAVIIAGETDKYILSFAPACINGTSKFSNGLAINTLDKNNSLINRSKSNFLSEENELFHKSLETPELRLSFYPHTLVMAEVFLQAKQRNKKIPELSIKNILKRVLEKDYYEFVENGQQNEIIKIIKNIAMINNLEKYAEALLKLNLPYNSVLPCEFNKENFTVIEKDELKNVYSASLLISEKYSLEHIYETEDLIVNSTNYQKFIKDFFGIDTFENINFSLLIKYSLPETIENLPEAYFIFIPSRKINYSSEQISFINQFVDHVWIKDESLFKYFSDMGIKRDKLINLNAYNPISLINSLTTEKISRFDYYKLALDNMEKEDYTKAINHFFQCLKEGSANKNIYYFMAVCLEKAGDLNTAKFYYEKAGTDK